MTVETTETTTTDSGAENANLSAETAGDTKTTGEVPQGAGNDPGATGDAQEYSPNFKYKVRDKELEFDEWARPFVKDVETEKKFRDLFEIREGLETIKSQREYLRQEAENTVQQFEHFKAEVAPTYETLNKLAGLRDQAVGNGDMVSLHNFFQSTGLPEHLIIRYAVEAVKRGSDAGAQNSWEQQVRQREAQQSWMSQQSEANTHISTLQSQINQMAGQQKNFELSQTLSQSDVAAFAKSFDERVGKPGAFRQECINRGVMYHHMSQGKIDKSAQEIVQEMMGLWGPPPQQQQQFGAPQNQQRSGGQSKPVIPNISGRGTSPARKAVKSLDDIKRIAAEMEAAQG